MYWAYMPLLLHSSLSVKIIAYYLTFINVGTSAKYQPDIISRGRKKRCMRIIVVNYVLKLFLRQSSGTSLTLVVLGPYIYGFKQFSYSI